MTQNNLGNALQTLGERETGTEHLEGAMAAWDECLSVTATAWPPEWVQSVRARRDATQAEIKRRSITERSDSDSSIRPDDGIAKSLG